MSYSTPNMGLLGISIGIDSGITIEKNYNLNMSFLDQHDHSSGGGVQIPPSGLNINSALTFNNQAATNVGLVNLSTLLSAPSTNVSLYSQGVDLYFLDGNGNTIQMTFGGAVLATSSGISSGTASASFSSGVLIVNAASNTPANIQAGSILLGNNVANSKFLTLSPPASMASNFSLVLPSIPVSQSFLSIDASGNIAAYAAVSGGITATNIANGTITGAKIATGTLTNANNAALPGGVSSSCGSFSTFLTYNNGADVTNLSVTYTATGSKLTQIVLSPDNTSNIPDLISSSSDITFFIYKDGSQFAVISYVFSVSSALTGVLFAPVFDSPSAGSHTYKVRAVHTVNNGSNSRAQLGNVTLAVVEL